MTFLTIRHIWEQIFPPKRLSCPRRLWVTLLQELRERGGHYRESGAFLLGHHKGMTRYITDFIPYDEIDPNCLTGGISFDGSKMDAVWAICRARKLQVVADVHTHPGSYHQSMLDQRNPMIPERGHMALIIPRFASRSFGPGEIGIYEFLGRGRWQDHSIVGKRVFSLRRQP